MTKGFLCLLLCLWQQLGAESTPPVHQVAISVQSVRSVLYRGMQVSIFEHVEIPRRYFFQPLSFIDCSSARLKYNIDRKLTELHVDVYLWTDDFIQLVESSFADHKSVELLPLTEISLAWSKQASLWLGEGFNRTYRLLDDWKDSDKPRMRNTLTIFCNQLDDCERLQMKFNQTDEAVSHLFDLRYKIQCDNSRNYSLSIRSSHFLQSSTFQLLSKFSAQHSNRRVIISDQTVHDLGDQVYAASLAELQRLVKQHFTYVNLEGRRAIQADLNRYLRSDPVQSLSKLQWGSSVYWPLHRQSTRPDKLSLIFNQLFTPSLVQPLMVELPNTGSLASARESLPPDEFAKIDAFVQLHAGRRKAAEPAVVGVDEVRGLASDLGSHVSWDTGTRKFAPPSSLVLYRVDLRAVQRRGILFMQDIAVRYRASEHADPVHPLPPEAAFQSSQWQRHFAASFCILANRGEPPGMQCRVLSYLLPTRSLQRNVVELADLLKPGQVSYNGGHAGQNHFYQVNPREFSFSLKICCTKDPDSP